MDLLREAIRLRLKYGVLSINRFECILQIFIPLFWYLEFIGDLLYNKVQPINLLSEYHKPILIVSDLPLVLYWLASRVASDQLLL